MRRSDREITDMDRIMEIVRRQSVCCVAFQDTPCPYLIPMNYGAALENGRLTLYFHGAAVGTKLDRLNADPHVSFTIVGGSQVSLNFEEACRSTAGFDSVCGTGTAEENAGGKAYLVRDGYFDDCDIAITWHPYTMSKVMKGGFHLANFRAFFTFHGISSHAAGAPELGRSALDAVEIMDIGVNYMREHMIDAARVHGAITNSGGIAPNVIPSEAQILYAIRAPKVTQVQKLFERMCDIARGAALITGTTVDIKQVAAYSDLINNETLNDLIQENLERVIPIGYTEEELDYARKFQSVITELDKEGLKAIAADIGGRDRKKELLETPLWDFIVDRNSRYGGGGSTDVGDVSWKVPTAHVYVNCYAAGTALHSWQATAQGKSSIAHKGMIAAAKVMANIGAELLLKPELVEKAKEDWKEELNGEEYPNPLPKDLKPEIW